MRTSFDDYTLLAGNYGLRGSLWKGPDHLLVVESKGFIFAYREVYRRIDYKNIQALILTRSSRYIWLAVLLGLALVPLFAWIVYWILEWPKPGNNHETTAVWIGVLGAIELVIAFVFGWHLIKGRTCVCSLQTAVLSLRLKPLKREAKARLALAELNAICRQHQGEMPTETGAVAAASQMPVTGIKPEWHGSKIVQWAFFITMIWGVIFASELFVQKVPYFITGIVLAMVSLALVIAGLAKAMRHRTQNGLVGLLWTNFGLLLIGGIAYYGLIVTGMIITQKDGPTNDPNAALKWMASLTMEKAQWAAWPMIGLGILTVVFALIGLIVASQRRAKPPVPASNTPPSMQS